MAGIKDAVVLVAGGASGIGEATVRRFINGGAKVAILDVQASKGSQLAEELGGDCSFFQADVREEKQVEECLDAVKKKYHRLDVLVNSAGVYWSTPTGETPEQNLQHARTMLDVNAMGMYTLVTLAVGVMTQNPPDEDGGRGVIINIASMAATDSLPAFTAYAGSKGAVASMTLPLARDLASHGIRVNSINPGFILTPMSADNMAKDPESFKKRLIFPKRVGRADEVAHLVQHMVENKYFNAASVRLDAGAR